MNLLLSLGPGVGYFMAFLVVALVGSIYAYCEFVLLKRAREHLKSDDLALKRAEAILKALATKYKSGVAPEEIYENLSQLPPDSAVYKRVQTLATHRAKNAISPVDRVALIETESARQQAGTNWPRFWAGGFTFIGLIGTLCGLSLAVFHLIAVVGVASADAASGEGLSRITSGMTATFSGMGGAFLSTAVGVLFSLVLSTTISRHEHNVENFRLNFEEFSHLQLEPFVSRAQIALREGENGLVVGGIWEEIDELAPMKALVERIERASKTFDDIAHSFAESMSKAARSFETLHGAADSTAASLHNANAAFLDSVRSLDKSLSPIGNKIGQLSNILEAQKTTQDAFLSHVGSSVSRLESSTASATEAFAILAKLEAGWNAKLDRQNTLLDQHLSGLSSSIDAIPAMLGPSLASEIKALSALLQPLPEYIQQSGQTLAQTLRDNGQEQRQLLASLEGLVTHLRSYTSQVDSAVERHAAAAYSKPFADFDTKTLEAARGVSASVSALQSEINGLKAAFGETGKAVGSINGRVSSQADQLKVVDERLSRISGLLERLNATPNVSESWIYSVDRLLKKF